MFQFKFVLSVALLLKWIGLIYYSSTMEHEVKCKSCLLQRSQLPCMGCSGRNLKTFNACKKHLFPCSFRPVAPLSIIHSLSYPFLVFLQWMLSLSQLCIQLESLFMFTNKCLLFLENPFFNQFGCSIFCCTPFNRWRFGIGAVVSSNGFQNMATASLAGVGPSTEHWSVFFVHWASSYLSP